MPCNHKFIEDLNLENLDFQPTTLIVGTFNPSWPENNQAQCFTAEHRIIISGMFYQDYMESKVF